MARNPEHVNAALLVIDVQKAVVEHAPDRAQVLSTINTLVDDARTAEIPVIWVQHNDADLPRGSEGWELTGEMSPVADDPVVHKQLRSSFDNTELESVLAAREIGRLIVAGAQTDFCVRWTLHGALELGYDTTLVADAHTTDDPSTNALPSAAQTVALLNNVWASQETSGPDALVMTSSEVNLTS